MVPVSFAERVVEVIATFGSESGNSYEHGSGCLVNGRYVLTAGHLVQRGDRPADVVEVRDCHKTRSTATILHPGGSGGLDLAALEVVEDNALRVLREHHNDLPPLPLARLARESSAPAIVDQVHALGYPSLAKTEQGTRDRAHAFGFIPALSHLTADAFSVQVVVAPPALAGATPWAGMSGGPVVANGCLLGVITRHEARSGQSTLTAVPITAALPDPTVKSSGEDTAAENHWPTWLGLRDGADVIVLPAPRTPPYHATFRNRASLLSNRTPTGRWPEMLTRMADFSTSESSALWLTGGPYSGKSTLLHEVIAIGLPDEVDAVFYFLSRATSDADGNRFLAAVVPQLAALCDATPTHQGRDELLDLWERAGQRAHAAERHLLLVVDGVDEDLKPPGVPGVMDLLPRHTRPNTHLLLSARKPLPVASTHPMHGAEILTLTGAPRPGAPGTGPAQEVQEIAGIVTSQSVDCLGFLTAAAGPIAERDLAVLVKGDSVLEPPGRRTLHVREVLQGIAGRTLDHLETPTESLWWFAHSVLLDAARRNPDLGAPRYRKQLHEWAHLWGSTAAPGGFAWLATPEGRVPSYLLDAYPQTLVDRDPQRLAALVTDAGWIEAAVREVGVEQVVSVLQTARACARQAGLAPEAVEQLSTMLSVVRGEARHFTRALVSQRGFVLRHMAMHAAELGADEVRDACNNRLAAAASGGPLFGWTTRVVSPAFVGESESCGCEVLDMAATPDGRVVTVGHDGWVLLWEPHATGSRPVRIGHHDGAARAVVVTDSGRVVTGGDDRCVRMWSLTGSAEESRLLGRHGGAVRAAAAVSDQRFVTSGHDGRVLLWDVEVSDPVEVGRHPSAVRAIGVTREGRILTGGDDGQILEWTFPGTSPEAGAAGPPGPRVVGRHDGAVRALALPDATTAVVTGGDDRRILRWEPTGASPWVASELARHRDAIRALLVCETDRVIAVARNGRILATTLGGPGDCEEIGRHGTRARAIARTSDGLLVSGGADGRIRVWDVDGAGVPRKRAGTAPAGGPASEPGDTHATALAVAPDGRVISGDADGLLQIWTFTSRTGRAAADASTRLGSGRVRAVATTTGGRIVSRSADGSLHLWRLDEPATVPTRIGSHSGLAALTTHGDEYLVTGGFDGRVLLWDLLAPAKPPTCIGRHAATVTAVVSVDTDHVVAGDGAGQLMVWAVGVRDAAARGTPVLACRPNDAAGGAVGVGAGIGALVPLPGGSVVAGYDDGLVALHASGAGGPVTLGSHEGPVNGAVALPDGGIATNGTDGHVRVWYPAGQQDGTTSGGHGAAPAGCLLATSAVALAASPANGDAGTWHLAVAHSGGGICTWV